MTSINTNTSALLARTHSIQSSDRQRTSMERLSSGSRINSSADDAAGLSVSRKMQSQLTSMNSALRNSMDGVSLIQTAMSSMSIITNMVQRMRELATQMHNGVYTDSDRNNAQLEISQLLSGISQMAQNTSFNNVRLLDGSYQNQVRAGHTNAEVIDVMIDGMGILPFIQGGSIASVTHTLSVLKPITSANGNSLLNYLSKSFAAGTSQLDILSQSNATGVSNFSIKQIDNAVGQNNLNILTSNSASGTSSFNTPNLINGTGISSKNLIASTNGNGDSDFRIPSSSQGSGSSNITIAAARAASGLSKFLTPQLVYADPNSLQAYKNISNARVAQSSVITTKQFENGDFSAGNSYGSSLTSGVYTSVAGWDIFLQQVALGPNDYSSDRADFSETLTSANRINIAGFPTPNDTGTPVVDPAHGYSTGLTGQTVANIVSGGQPNFDQNGNPSWQYDFSDRAPWGDDYKAEPWGNSPVTFNYLIENGEITLGTSAILTGQFGQAHGPYIVSKSPVSLKAGDQVSFDWLASDATFAQNGSLSSGNGDAFDVYGYLLDVNTGDTIELINKHSNNENYNMASTTGFQTETTTVSQEGDYKFVFISGSYDASGGTRAGGSFKITNVTVTEANPPSSNETTARVTVKAEEADLVSIDNLLLAEMDKIVLNDPGVGVFSILNSRPDHTKFQIDVNGDITSTQPLRYATQQSYTFDVMYQPSTGGSHIETVTLELGRSKQSTSSASAQEANTLAIRGSSLDLLAGFASANPGGQYRIDPSRPDSSYFDINDTTGYIQSKAALDFDTQSSYVFDVIYRASDGREYTDTVTLNLLDTLQSTATLTVEETQSLTIAEDTLTSTEHYATTKDGAGETGTYALSGTHSNLFTVAADGAITSTGTVNKGTYNFNVNYTDGNGVTHVEAVTLNVTEALQSSSTLSAAEADTVGINASAMSNLADFASRHSGGSYRLAATGDYNKFDINSSTGRLTSKAALDFDTQASYNFDVIYRTTVNGAVTEFTESVTLNLTDTLFSDANITAEETQSLTIAAATLSSTNAFATKDPGVGNYSLTGADANKFSIDGSGNVTSTGTVTQGSYNFNVVYTASNGPIHTEAVSLTLTEALQGSSTITAHEANQITIASNVMSSIHSFANRDGFGSYRLGTSGSDYNKFTINASSGNITSLGTIEFDSKPTLTFDVIYDGSDGRTFTETVTLNVGDTLNSSASLSAEETQSLTISAATLSSTKAFATKDPGVGSYSLNGTNANLFNIDSNGNITSKNAMLRTSGSQYNFNVNYTSSTGKTHSEAVTLTLTEALQSVSTLSAFEANNVVINPATSSYLNAFASRDDFRGRYTLQGADVGDFIISNTGVITSRNQLEYDNQAQYNIEAIYTASDGRIFKDVITLNLKDTLLSRATIYAEQSHDVDIAAATLSSTNAFATKDLGVGTYSLTGADSDKFTIDSSGNITSKSSLLQANQLQYKFNVKYNSSTGKEHLEEVTLNLTESLQATATLTVQESDRVYITSGAMEYIQGFAQRDNFEGGWRIVPSGGDHTQFEISADGTVQSKTPLDFSTQNQYSFQIAYQSGDATREFVQTINLALTDTLTGTTTFTAEEGEIVEIDGNVFTATNNHITANGASGGTYRLDPTTEDYNEFTINSATGSIRSKGELRLASEENFDLRVIYTRPDGVEFSETVDMRLTESTFNKSRSEVTVSESEVTQISLSELTNINRYSKNDQSAGSFRLAADIGNTSDYKSFTVDANGNIQSSEPLDFESGKTEYNFRLFYDFANQSGTYEENIKLTVTNDLRDDNNLNLSSIDISTANGARDAMSLLDETIVRLSASQAKIGATQNRIQHNINNLFNSSRITNIANGRIIDADFAVETTQLAKESILNNAAAAMLAQANNEKTNVLKLIQL